MKERVVDPLKLDVEAFARDGASLQGSWPASTLERIADSAAPEAPVGDWPPVQWTVRGERRTPRGGEAEIWLHLEADARAQLTCQRCLKPVEAHVAFARWFRFVRDEAVAAELDADSEEDVLTLTRHLDLRELVEDELLLELPLVPRHDSCPEPLPRPLEDADDAAIEEERPNPFAALAALKGKGRTQ
ncbi:YceD family protein [Paucibacter sediminis]|uniref:Large ribosomal RNA subunit accumulation protein YceD n=1 Tax=Paucibacter sediminis TaxID=3019553 RepID=A0AA95SNQ6_9BURK|nr:YceD family protein [Paucibacter sp. S2-9]WIT09996.1 YceD family protein [Paucibacter sp. S2-9]